MPAKNKKWKNPKPCQHRNRKRNCRGMCRQCYTSWLREVNLDYRKNQDENKAKYYRKNRKKLLSLAKKRAKTLHGKRIKSNAQLRHKFGIDLDGYNKRKRKQKNRCKICGRRNQRKTRLHVDHNHKTGKIRGLLCFECNAGLGKFMDDPILMLRAILYLLLEGEI